MDCFRRGLGGRFNFYSVNKSSSGRSRRWKVAGALLVSGTILGVILVWCIGSTLIAPANRQIGNPPPGLGAQSVTFSSASGSLIHGWLVPAAETNHPKGVIVLMHGIHANRLSMVQRAQLLHETGYSVLLFDFQAHGESPGTYITMGHLESRDATAAVGFAHQKYPGQKVGVIGVSMGAAAALLADPPLPVDAMVLESCYPTVYQAVDDRLMMRFGILGKLGTPLLVCQLKPRLGFGPEALCPIVNAAKITVPKFFIAGTADHDTTVQEARELYGAAAGPKQLWLVENAAHVDMQAFAKAEYKKRVLAFLATYLQ